MTTTIELEPGLTIEVTGTYEAAEFGTMHHQERVADFTVEKWDIIQGTLLELIEWWNNQSKHFDGHFKSCLSRLVLTTDPNA